MSNQVPTGERAEALARHGRLPEALSLLNGAVARNDPDACLCLAFWRLTGQFVPRDLAIARSFLRRARELGDCDAGAMEIALTANGSGAPADWPAALQLLRNAAINHPAAAAELKLIDAMDVADNGIPIRLPDPEPLMPDAGVRRFPGLLTFAECEHVARAAVGWLQPAVVVDPQTGRQMRHPHRTSDDAVLGPTRETLPIRAINLRIAAASGTSVDQGEALTVLRYAPGQEFKLHLDSLPNTPNQRVMTVLLYLNAGFRGGETVFPEHGLTIRPGAGDAIVFANTDAQGRPDPRSRHAGLPVTQGVKWLATRWIRQRPIDPWTIGAPA